MIGIDNAFQVKYIAAKATLGFAILDSLAIFYFLIAGIKILSIIKESKIKKVYILWIILNVLRIVLFILILTNIFGLGFPFYNCE